MSKTITIPKGKHRGRPVRPRVYWKRKRLCHWVQFDFSCRYELPENDGRDYNKLFGLAWWPGTHTSSARFGWRWNNDKKKIELCAYLYEKGNRKVIPLCHVKLTYGYELSIKIEDGGIRFRVIQLNNMFQAADVWILFNGVTKFSYGLGVYFGGNRQAPHNMKIYMKHV